MAPRTDNRKGTFQTMYPKTTQRPICGKIEA
jgi:hypothetical protein